jgi:putative membrane protein
MSRQGLTIFAALPTSLIAGAALADPTDGRYFDHMGMMGWGGWFYGPLMMVVFFALLVGAVLLIVRLLGANSRDDGTGPGDRALQILRERFAKGEITREEFEDARKVLG